MEPFHPDMRFVIILTIGLFMKNLLSITVFFLVLISCTVGSQNTKLKTDKGVVDSTSITPLSVLKVDKRRSEYEKNPRSIMQVYDETTSSLIIHTKYNCTLPINESEYFPVFCLDLIHMVGAGDPTEYTWVVSVILEKQTSISHMEISSPMLQNPLKVIPPQIPIREIGSNLGVLHQLYFATDEDFIVSMLVLNPVTLSLFDNDTLIFSVVVQPETKQLWFDFMNEVKSNYNRHTESL